MSEGAGAVTRVPFVDLRAGDATRRATVDAAWRQVVERGDFILGEAVARFEEAFAAYCGVPHAVAVDSGFSALELTFRAHDIGPGDEVVTAANTFVATVAAIESVGARPVLVDIAPETYTLDPEQVAAAVTRATRAIVPVHLYGRCAGMEELTAVAADHGLWVFEDACQAHGATYRGRRAGNLGHAAAFSFYPSKNLGAFGDGGLVTTRDAQVARRLQRLRNLGMARKHHHATRGFNHRLDTVHAAVLGAKLPYLDEDNRARRSTAGTYARLLERLPVHTPAEPPDGEHAFHLYVIEVAERDRLRTHLEAAGVGTGIHYPVPVHMHPPYRSLGTGPGSFPLTERAAARILSLPMYPGMREEAVVYSASAIHEFFSSNGGLVEHRQLCTDPVAALAGSPRHAPGDGAGNGGVRRG